ncbi:MAG: betaine--homocysteine S-methyltransferase [Gammaproteobacteria bacterium]|nr:betaine--homocysteine S-methyltransferase [Gammaproteobacteria bacterium]
MKSTLSELLEERECLLADGATGSNLFEVGLQTGDSPELWNDIHPDRIANQYQSFIDAGSDIILTNSFGGTRYRLKLHNAEHRVEELNIKAAKIARKLADQCHRAIVVGGSMGPTGEILEPLGPLSVEDAASAFEEQALALKAGGVDVLWIETMSSEEEASAAVKGANKSGLPIVTTYSVDTNGRTMMGLTPADIVRFSARFDPMPFAIGANCGIGASESVAAVINMMHESTSGETNPIVVVKANCGVPKYIDGKIVYSGTTEVMSEYVKLALDAGARIVGGCCGTTPLHVREMRKALDEHPRGSVPDLESIEQKLGEVSNGAKAQLRGEMSIAAGALNNRTPRKRSRRR